MSALDTFPVLLCQMIADPLLHCFPSCRDLPQALDRLSRGHEALVIRHPQYFVDSMPHPDSLNHFSQGYTTPAPQWIFDTNYHAQALRPTRPRLDMPSILSVRLPQVLPETQCSVACRLVKLNLGMLPWWWVSNLSPFGNNGQHNV